MKMKTDQKSALPNSGGFVYRAVTPDWMRRLSIVMRKSLSSWMEHRAISKGAALAFYTLFSMTPILVLSIAVAGYVFGAEAAQGEIVAQVQGLVGPNGAQAIQALLAAAQDPTSGLVATLVASVLLLLGATSVFVELKVSLHHIGPELSPGIFSFTLASYAAM
jgi:membrane protein